MAGSDDAEVRDDVATSIEIARRYYLEDQSKVAIAKDFGLSRFQVARILREAREQGIVRIEVGAPLGHVDHGLSTALQAVLGVRRATVVATTPGQSPASTVRRLGQALASELSTVVAEGDVLGLAWSRVSDAMVDQLSRLERCTVVQLAGHLHRPGDTSGSVEAVRRTALVAGGVSYPIYAPMLVEDASTAATLLRQPEIADALRRADELDKAVVSVGAWGSKRSRVYDTVGPDIQRAGTRAGVCGEISGRLFDTTGAPVPDLIDDRVIAITLNQLRNVPEVIATAWGAESATALRVAVEAGLVDAVVVDEGLARQLADA